MNTALLTLTTYANEWTDGNWLDAILGPYVALFGDTILGTMLAGSLITAFWIYSGDIVLPSVLVLLLGGVLTAVLPGQVVGIARAMIVIALATAFLAAARRYMF